MAKAILRERKRAPTDFANESEVNEADAPALGSATGREEGRPEDEPIPISKRRCMTTKQARNR